MFRRYSKLKTKNLKLFVFILLTSSFLNLKSQNVTNRILFVFDDSYSMYSIWNNNTRIEVAKKVMGEFMDSLKNVPDLEIALRCYGHTTFFRPERNCKDSQLEVPFAPAKTNALKIKQRILRLEPLGTTPIAYSLGEAAKNDFPPCDNCRNMIVLITDGIEECGGNPCEVSLMMQRQGIFLRPFVIGLGLDLKFMDVMGCIGKFYDVSNEANFRDVLNLVITEALTQTTVQVDLLDTDKKPTETDVNMTFYEAGTNKVKYNYLHTINTRGNPDTLILDPNLKYDLVVHSIPQQEKKNISIVKGKHNTIPVDAPQGFMHLDLEGVNSNKIFPATIVRKGGDMKTLNIQDFNKTEKYITGKYDLEVLTLPRIYMKDVEIKQSSTNTIKIPASGSVQFSKPEIGYGSIYVDNGKQVTWVCNLKPNLKGETVYLQPGKYKAVFRTGFSKETLKTVEKNFEVKSGAVITVNLF